MKINGIDIQNYGARLLKWDPQPATIVNSEEWLRNSISPSLYNQQLQYKKTTAEIQVIGEDRTDAYIKCSKLIYDLKKCTLEIEDIGLFYDCILESTSIAKGIVLNKLTLTCTFNTDYAYKTPINQDFKGSTTVNVEGTEKTPAIITITEPVDTSYVYIDGITDTTIRLLYLKKDIPVTIDGEKKLIYEPDLDHWVTEDTGENKWIFKRWNIALANDPELFYPKIIPQKSNINKSISPYNQSLLTDGATLINDNVTNYYASIRTALYVSNSKSITFKFEHDDGVNLYLNGDSVYSNDTAEAPETGNAGYPSVTLNLSSGWNIIEFLYINHQGSGGVWGITPTIGSLVEKVNCFYSRDLDYLPTANKFAEADFWEFPKLAPGTNIINLNDNNASATISYKPRFN